MLPNRAVYLAAAAKYRRLTHRLSQEQKGLDERARTASQRPSPPCGRPRSRPCGRTAPAQATSPCRFPPPRRAHSSAGCGHGGTRNSSTSRNVQTRSVSPAAIAGVRGCHVFAEPAPLVGTGCARACLPCPLWWKANNFWGLLEFLLFM